MGSLYLILEIQRILLNFHSLHIYVFILNTYMTLKVLKDTLYLYVRLCVTKHCSKFVTCSEWHKFMNF